MRTVFMAILCPYFAPLREGKNINEDKDLVDYFQNVFEIREDLENEGP